MSCKYRSFVHFAAVLALSTVLISCAREEPPAEIITENAVSPYHIVKKGETLRSIASKYGMERQQLIDINNLKSPYRIYVGQRLLVKVDGAADGPVAVKPRTNVADTGEVEVQELAPKGNSLVPGVAPTMGSGVPGSSTAIGGAAALVPGAPTDGSVDMPATDPVAVAPSGPVTPASAGKLRWPAQGQVIKGFGVDAAGQRNDGINIAVPEGTTVAAVDNGVVAHVGNKARGFGNLVLVKHEGGKISVYGHLKEASVRQGQTISAGEKVGTAGTSGGVSQSQVHFEYRQGKTALNPEDYLK